MIVSTPRATAASATFSAGSIPSTGTPLREEVLQEIPVVRRELDDEASGPSESRSHISSTYVRACSTHESEYAEKYAYSLKISSGAASSGIWASQQRSQTRTWSG